MYAVVTINGKQHKVSPGDIVEVEKLPGVAGETVTVSDVLLVSDGKKTTVGTPAVAGAKVKLKILAQDKGEKIYSMRYKAKVRVRKRRGFRPQITRLEVLSIA